jgi:hypothetical protein
MGHEYIKHFFIQKPIQVNCGEERLSLSQETTLTQCFGKRIAQKIAQKITQKS